MLEPRLVVPDPARQTASVFQRAFGIAPLGTLPDLGREVGRDHVRLAVVNDLLPVSGSNQGGHVSAVHIELRRNGEGRAQLVQPELRSRAVGRHHLKKIDVNAGRVAPLGVQPCDRRSLLAREPDTSHEDWHVEAAPVVGDHLETVAEHPFHRCDDRPLGHLFAGE